MSADRPELVVIADLDAGLVDGVEVGDSTAQQVRAEAAQDPRTAAVLDALALTRAELGALPAVPVPPAAAKRWAELFDESPEPAAPTPLRPRRRFVAAGVAAAAAAVLVAIAVLLTGQNDDVPSVTAVQLAATAQLAVGAHDAGGLDDPVRRAGCLRAAAPQVGPDAPLLGALRVRYDGRPGVLLLLGTGRLGVFDVVVVDPACGAGGGTLIAVQRVP